MSDKIEPQVLIDFITRRCPELEGATTGDETHRAYYLVAELCSRYIELRDTPLSNYLDAKEKRDAN